MARQKNDGRGRLGGRAKGTPNRYVSFAVWADGFLCRNRQEFENEYQNLSTDSRMKIFAAMSVARAVFPDDCFVREPFSIAGVSHITKRLFNGHPAEDVQSVGEGDKDAKELCEEDILAEEYSQGYQKGVKDANEVKLSWGIKTDEEIAADKARSERFKRHHEGWEKGYQEQLDRLGIVKDEFGRMVRKDSLQSHEA